MDFSVKFFCGITQARLSSFHGFLASLLGSLASFLGFLDPFFWIYATRLYNFDLSTTFSWGKVFKDLLLLVLITSLHFILYVKRLMVLHIFLYCDKEVF